MRLHNKEPFASPVNKEKGAGEGKATLTVYQCNLLENKILKKHETEDDININIIKFILKSAMLRNNTISMLYK